MCIRDSTYVIEDDALTTRQVYSKPITSRIYISDRPTSILASSRGSNSYNTVYSFGKGRNTTYMALAGNTSSYGTSVSRDARYWSALNNTTASIPSRVYWDGLKWIALNDNTNDLLVSYDTTSFVTGDSSNSTISSIQYNGQIYVGVGKGGLFYGYDGIHWIQSATGTTCLLYTSPSPRDGLLSRMPSSA